MRQGPWLDKLDRLEVVDEADDVDIDLRDDLDLLRSGGLTDLVRLSTGEDTGDINGVAAGDTIGVVTGDICVGEQEGDGESNGTIEGDGTGTGEEVSVVAASLRVLKISL